jgi:hypothetical protein
MTGHRSICPTPHYPPVTYLDSTVTYNSEDVTYG